MHHTVVYYQPVSIHSKIHHQTTDKLTTAANKQLSQLLLQQICWSLFICLFPLFSVPTFLGSFPLFLVFSQSVSVSTNSGFRHGKTSAGVNSCCQTVVKMRSTISLSSRCVATCPRAFVCPQNSRPAETRCVKRGRDSSRSATRRPE